MSDEPDLGNLAQAARGNQLRSARWIMIVVGLMTLVLNGFYFASARKSVDNEIAELQQQGMQIDMSQVENIVRLQQLVTGGAAAIGVVFIVLGALVYKFPVPCTVAGLVLYILSALVFAVLDPTSIVRGVIVKVIIVVGLFKSMQSAFAYQAELKAQNTKPDGFTIN